ncbi:MAG TPA: methyltransferase domain-containing protein, partial [Gammaproteobacteria bacterium]|nr:methyltransferase domain-containing protein [Gammaproteobacteria bacterium]
GPLARRLAIVQRHIAEYLDSRGDRHTSVISMCSGDGRDLLGALASHGAKAGRLTALLVELDPVLRRRARRRIRDAGLAGIQVVARDAGLSSSYVDAAPADLVLACGVFGNVADEDVERTVRHMPRLCRQGATVIWTRHRRPPDLTVSIRRWFREAGFENGAFEPVPDSFASVGVERFKGEALPLVAGTRLFEFDPGRQGRPRVSQAR